MRKDTISTADDGTDDTDVECPYCEMRFTVIFSLNPIYDGIEYCPFCGEEWDEN